MVLIAILICLALQRVANIGSCFQLSWFESYLKYLTPWLSKLNEWLALSLMIAPVLFLLVLLQFLFSWRLFGLCNLVLATFVLFLCIDARDFKNQLTVYFTDLEKEDIQAATDAVVDITGNVSFLTSGRLCRSVTETVLLKSFEQLFAGMFWFIVFGIYGVVVYFLITLLRRNSFKVDSNYVELATLAERIQNILNLIPSRLVGLSYALAGNFNKGFRYCRYHLLSGPNEVNRFSIDAGLAALDVGIDLDKVNQKENYETLDLINRVLIIWIVALALVLLGFYL